MPEWFPPATAAFRCWGVWAFLPALTTRYIDPRSTVIYEALGGLLVAGGVLAVIGFKPAQEGRGIILAQAAGSLGVAGALAYLYAMQKGPVALIATVTALYPMLAVILAAVLLHQPVSLRQALALSRDWPRSF